MPSSTGLNDKQETMQLNTDIEKNLKPKPKQFKKTPFF